MIRSQLRQIAQHGDRAWMGMAKSARHFSASHAAAAEGQKPPSGMQYILLPFIIGIAAVLVGSIAWLGRT